MLTGLKLINFAPCEASERLLKEKSQGQIFVMRTCQRTLVLGFNNLPETLLGMLSHQENSKAKNPEFYRGLEAYQFLLETICGLKSRILGENEIVHQFKEAYTEFMGFPKPNRLVQSLLEKLFKDAKDIRSQHLKNIGLQTYAGITRQLLNQRVKSSEKVVIFGSGELAEDIIKISRRRFSFVVCARNKERLGQLQETYKVETLSWEERARGLTHKAIINTIGTGATIFSVTDLALLNENNSLDLLVDLAQPSPVDWRAHLLSNRPLFDLEAIFKLGEHFNKEKISKVEKANEAIKEVTKHRHHHFTLHLPFGWDELQFA